MTVEGLMSIPSVDGYAATVGRLDVELHARAITPMLRWDHAAAAADVGLELRPLLLIVFGDPRAGTKLMQDNPTTGIDLPLKLLVWETDAGRVMVGYNDPAWIRARHGLGPVPAASGGMESMLQALAQTAAGQPRA